MKRILKTIEVDSPCIKPRNILCRLGFHSYKYKGSQGKPFELGGNEQLEVYKCKRCDTHKVQRTLQIYE